MGRKETLERGCFSRFPVKKSVMWKRARRSVKLHEAAYRLIGSFFATVLQVPKDFLGSIQFWFPTLVNRSINSRCRAMKHPPEQKNGCRKFALNLKLLNASGPRG